MGSPLVSIIIPTYNRSKLLMECLQSILSQTYLNFEVLILDDGSTDDTEIKVKGLDKRIVYHKLNKIGNLSLLRNYGVKHSEGGYIAFCDDDDLWFPEKLNEQLNYSDNYNIICTNAQLIDNKGKSRNEIYCKDFYRNTQLSTIHLLLRNYVVTSTVLIKKEILSENPFDMLRYKSTAEDYELWLRLSLNNPIYFINRELVKYRIHSNLTYQHDNYPLIFTNSIDILNKYKKMVPGNCRKYADLGIFRFRKEYIKLNLHRKKYFIVLKELICISSDHVSPPSEVITKRPKLSVVLTFFSIVTSW